LRDINRQEIQAWLDNHMTELDCPEAYLGDEPGLIPWDWDGGISPRILCVGGDSYTTLSGNMAVPLLTQMINSTTTARAHRAYFPNTQSELNRFLKAGIPIFSIEEKRPIQEYDIMAFSCCYVLLDMMVIRMLAMSDFPIMAKERIEDDSIPLAIRGGEAMQLTQRSYRDVS